MKRRTTPIKRSGISSYKRHGKRPCDYSAMYARCTHLRRPSSGDKAGEYTPHVANPLASNFVREVRQDMWERAA